MPRRMASIKWSSFSQHILPLALDPMNRIIDNIGWNPKVGSVASDGMNREREGRWARNKRFILPCPLTYLPPEQGAQIEGGDLPVSSYPHLWWVFPSGMNQSRISLTGIPNSLGFS